MVQQNKMFHIKIEKEKHIAINKLLSLMEWNPKYRYKLLGKLIRSNNELLFIFDLNSPEIRTKIKKNK